MPLLSQLMIRAALLWLALGYTFGGLALLNKGLPLMPWLWTLRASHVHMLLLGWMLQLACGVAFWILPRHTAAGDRGATWPVWLCFVALNLGVALATLHAPLAALNSNSPRNQPLLLLAGLLYAIAASAFCCHAWHRVLPWRTLPRMSTEG